MTQDEQITAAIRERYQETIKMLDQKKIIEKVLAQYRLPLDGHHGPAHWARVYDIGQQAAKLWNVTEQAKIDLRVPALFAMLHDACRENEAHDPDHGLRAAVFAHKLRTSGVFTLPNTETHKLYEAIELHADGTTCGDPTVQVCYDSDRLDLPRVGIIPDKRLISARVWGAEWLCENAFRSSVKQTVSMFTLADWGLTIATKEIKPKGRTANVYLRDDD